MPAVGGTAGSGRRREARRCRGWRSGKAAQRSVAAWLPAEPAPRVILRFPANPDDMLLSGVLVGGQALANRAQVVDAPLGKGHVVMFAIRPFWRWQTQGTCGLGFEGLMNLYQFVKDGGLLVVEGATSTIFPRYKLVNGVTVESPAGLFMRGSIVRGIVADAKSPIMYGYDGAQIPVYFSQDPVLNAGGPSTGSGQGGGGRGGAGGGEPIPGVGMNVAPNAGSTQKLSPWEPGAPGAAGQARVADAGAGRGAAAGGRGGSAGGMAAGGADAPRVILRFPANPDEMLLSGVLVGGQALANRAQVVDAPLGTGQVVMFAIRPYWRWQTQGTALPGFNAIMKLDDIERRKVAQ